MLLRNEKTGISYRLGNRIRIGREPGSASDISIADESVSRQHGEITKEPVGFVLRDIGSKNGTFVNGKRIGASKVIVPGDTIRIGKVVFVAELTEGAILPTEDLIDPDSADAALVGITRVGLDPKTLRVMRHTEKEPPQQGDLLRKRLGLLAKLTTSIRAAAGLADLEQKIAIQTLATFPSAKRCILVVQGGDGNLSVRAITSRPMESTAHLRISRTIINHVLDEARAVLCADAMSEDRYAHSQSVRAMDIHSFMCAPLLGSKKPFGVVYLDTVDSRKQFSEEDLALLTVVANQAALALENARFVEQIDLDRDVLAEQNRRLRGSEATMCDFESIVHVSQKMRDILDLTRRIVPTDSPVLILGDRGTGKELIARAIHYNGPRRDQTLEILNCAAISGQLVESELFGHEKGAFTGADRTKPGLFEIANHGTLFLDEVGDLPFETQAKLLRATEYGQIRRVGGTKDIEVDVRLIAATNKDLKKEVDENRFRADLYDRLNVAVIRLPSLSERREDVLPLANHFIALLGRKMSKTVKGLSDQAVTALQGYGWPGNARELRNVIEKAMIQMSGDVIDVRDLPPDLLEAVGSGLARYKRLGKLSEAEAALKFEMISDALREAGGNRSKAAEILGVSRAGLRKMMDALGIR